MSWFKGCLFTPALRFVRERATSPMTNTLTHPLAEDADAAQLLITNCFAPPRPAECVHAFQGEQLTNPRWFCTGGLSKPVDLVQVLPREDVLTLPPRTNQHRPLLGLGFSSRHATKLATFERNQANIVQNRQLLSKTERKKARAETK